MFIVKYIDTERRKTIRFKTYLYGNFFTYFDVLSHPETSVTSFGTYYILTAYHQLANKRCPRSDRQDGHEGFYKLYVTTIVQLTGALVALRSDAPDDELAVIAVRHGVVLVRHKVMFTPYNLFHNTKTKIAHSM